jgi:3-deoxy-D-manno-octulosonic acid kinase
VLASLVPTFTEILARSTLYEYAAAHPARRTRTGRAPVYIVPLEGSVSPVVVRHAWHGGMLAPLTGDRFVAPTRAPYELATSVRLAALGVPTPRVVGYAVYPAGALLRRSDVVTEEIPHSDDLAALLGGASMVARREEALAAAEALLLAMGRAGARHPDLNLKNILIAKTSTGMVEAFLLDVDRVSIDRSRARAAASNAARLARSARKWRNWQGIVLSDAELAALERAALGGRS